MIRIGLLMAAGTAALLPLAAFAVEPPSSIRRFRSDTVVEPDGRAVQTWHMEIAVNNDAVARREAQQGVVYSDGVETIELVEGYTLKPDGRRLPVTPGAVRTQLAPGSPNLPEYTSRKQVVAVLPDVAGGDVLSLTWRRTIHHPVFPGQFAFTGLFPRAVPWDDAESVISVPEGVTLATEAYGPEHTEADEGGRHIHRWNWSAPALASDPAVLSPLDRAPRIFASTFSDWPEFGHAYAGLIAPKTEVTPRIQALADQVAAGAADRREEAKRLYEWVSRRVRWVAIYVGDGAFVPHAADEVLANGYGDCKDQVVLLVALLHARGIAAEPVLVNLGPTYTFSGVPTLTAFNHVITYLPEWDLYADTTAGGAPFGTVPAAGIRQAYPARDRRRCGAGPHDGGTAGPRHRAPEHHHAAGTERARDRRKRDRDGRTLRHDVASTCQPGDGARRRARRGRAAARVEPARPGRDQPGTAGPHRAGVPRVCPLHA